MPQVTVILPVHNGANYLKEAVASVLAQSFEDFELHVLDDDSSDESPAIAQSTGDPRVRYSRNPGRFGLFKTLNRGFSEARSPLVRLWAHDDRMLPTNLGRFVDFMDRHKTAGMAYSDFFEIDAAGRRTGGEELHRAQRVRTPEIAHPRVSALLFWCYGCLPGNISTVIVRREAWARVGGFRTGIQQAPDYDMWVRLSESSDVGFLSEKLVDLRAHPLQLGRMGQKEMTTVEEELPVVQCLEERLAGVLEPDELLRGWRTERGRQHVHWVARAILRGDVTSARRGWAAIRRYRQPMRQVAFWLVSANGRFFMPDRNALYDRRVGRCSSPPLASNPSCAGP